MAPYFDTRCCYLVFWLNRLTVSPVTVLWRNELVESSNKDRASRPAGRKKQTCRIFSDSILFGVELSVGNEFSRFYSRSFLGMLTSEF